MRDRCDLTSQLLFTLLVAAFLIVPAVLSMMAGVTVNYFRGIRSGLTLAVGRRRSGSFTPVRSAAPS